MTYGEYITSFSRRRIVDPPTVAVSTQIECVRGIFLSLESCGDRIGCVGHKNRGRGTVGMLRHKLCSSDATLDRLAPEVRVLAAVGLLIAAAAKLVARV